MAPSFCMIWFINKGKLVWKRQISEGSSSEGPALASILRSQSLRFSHVTVPHEGAHSSSAGYIACSATINHFQREGFSAELASSPTLYSKYNPSSAHLSSAASVSSSSGYSSSEPRVSSDSGNKNEEEYLCEQLLEVKREAEQSRAEALTELQTCRKLEVEAVDAISQVT